MLIYLLDADLRELNALERRFVLCGHSFDLLDDAHAPDDAAEDGVQVVERRRGSGDNKKRPLLPFQWILSRVRPPQFR